MQEYSLTNFGAHSTMDVTVSHHLDLSPLSLQVKVLLRVCPTEIFFRHGNSMDINSRMAHSPSRDGILSVKENRKQVTIFNSASGLRTAHERVGVSAPKVYTFDAVFPSDSSQVRPRLM